MVNLVRLAFTNGKAPVRILRAAPCRLEYRLWSHTFYDWDEILPPNLRTEHWTEDKTVFPSLSLDYRRFNSDCVRHCY